jgi:hypothetical protein
MKRPKYVHGLRTTFEMFNAETQLMYSSDYPHSDIDHPTKSKRQILGSNACRRVGIEQKGLL